MRNFQKWTVGFVVAVAASMGTADEASAAMLTFGRSTSGSGTVTYNGSGGALVGTGIAITTLTVEGTGVTDGTYAVTALLNFTTGNNISEPTTSPFGFWEFGSGGTFTITGSIAALGIVNETLLTGSYVSNPTASGGVSGTNLNLTFGGTGVDTKNDTIVDYFGLVGGAFEFAATEISLGQATVNGTTFSINAGVSNVQVQNTGQSEIEVPEPASAFLAISCLAFAGLGVGRRKKTLSAAA